MKPPLYYTLTNRVRGLDEEEKPCEWATEAAVQYARELLDVSEYREENTARWIEFCRDNPDDPAAKFMAPLLMARAR